MEKRVAAIWEDVLSTQQVPLHESFFQLGGNSLGATRVISRIRQVLGVELDIRDLFNHGTVSELAALVEQRQTGVARREDVQEIADASDTGALLARVEQMSDSEVAELLARLKREEESE
jgi:acyl carrier protein